MIYIGFSTISHKTSAKILCKKYRHCAPVLIHNNKCVLYQFVAYKKIVPIHIRPRDLNKLELFGWKFIKYSGKFAPGHALKSKSITCVQFTKHALHIKNIAIQTPDALLRYLTKDKKQGQRPYFIVFLITYIWNIPNTLDTVQ